MSEQIQTLIVNRDGEFDPESSILPPTGIEAAVDHVQAAFSRFTGNIALQTRMAVFDVRHGTDYRNIRNALVEQKRREEFLESIGLVAIKGK